MLGFATKFGRGAKFPLSCYSRTQMQSSSSWKVGDNQPLPFKGKWMDYTFDQLKASGGAYSLLISTVVPRPIALITSQNSAGQVNCAPYSYFNVVCHDPPLVVIGMNLNVRAGTKKDTLSNVEQTGQFVINVMSSWYLESANHCSGAFDPDQNELDIAGLTSLSSDVVSPPRVAEAAVQFECEVVSVQPHFNDAKQHTVSVVTGRIVKFHVHEGVLTDSAAANPLDNKPVVDWEKLKPVGRMGGETYTVVSNGRDLKRPHVK